MKMNQIILSNMKIIYTILFLMNFLGIINCQNESKRNNANFEKILPDNRKRKLQSDNYISITYIENVEYADGFSNNYRGNIVKIVYNDNEYGNTQSLSISADQEVKIYISEESTGLPYFFESSNDPKVVNIKSIDFSHLVLLLQ